MGAPLAARACAVASYAAFAGQTGQLDARVYDVTPEGKQVMISRGAYRIEVPRARAER